MRKAHGVLHRLKNKVTIVWCFIAVETEKKTRKLESESETAHSTTHSSDESVHITKREWRQMRETIARLTQCLDDEEEEVFMITIVHYSMHQRA